MKKVFIPILLFALALTACNNAEKPAGNSNVEQVNDTSATVSDKDSNLIESAANEVISSYIDLKNALAINDSKGAADAGNKMVEAMNKIDKASLTAEKQKVYDDVVDDAKEHAEHIGKNNGNIKHQREHFDMLSKDMYDFVKVFGAKQTLYQTHCPMYNDNKGATWLSETKDIKNPYMGKEMSTCGEVKEEIKN